MSDTGQVAIQEPLNPELCSYCYAPCFAVYLDGKTELIDPDPAWGGQPPSAGQDGHGSLHKARCPNRRFLNAR
jgi:hypothetical protein